MKITICSGDRQNEGVLTVPVGVCREEPMIFDATFPYKKLCIVIEQNAVFSFYEEAALEELTIIAHESCVCRAHVVITHSQEKKITLSLKGECAQVDLTCFYILNGAERATILAHQEHHAAYTKSSIVSRGALAGTAYVEHKGMIFIANKAIQSKALHNNKTILLSRGSQLVSSPELEVLQRNVQCSHGTAVGPLDEEQLLYLHSRGLTDRNAQLLLLEAFFNVSDESTVKKSRTEGLIKKLQEMV